MVGRIGFSVAPRVGAGVGLALVGLGSTNGGDVGREVGAG